MNQLLNHPHGSTWIDTARVPVELVESSRRMGLESRELAIVAEGNLSVRDGAAMIIKASGRSLAGARADDFVHVQVDALTALVDARDATQDDLDNLLRTSLVSDTPRASIEALLHAVIHGLVMDACVIHTHPTYVLGLLSSEAAAHVFDEPVYADEAVVLGKPLFVPYAAPGLALGRAIRTALDERLTSTGETPSLVLLQNHGIVAISSSLGGAESVTLMADKSARVRFIATSFGGPRTLGPSAVKEYLSRPDFAGRRARLS